MFGSTPKVKRKRELSSARLETATIRAVHSLTKSSGDTARQNQRPVHSEARMTERKSALHCAHCSRSLKGARVVVVNAGEVFHRRCFENDRAHDAIYEFLRRHYPSGFCADCLCMTVDLTHDQARTLIRTSRRGPRLVILIGVQCAGCRRSRLTVQADGYADPPGPGASRSLA